MTQRGAKRGELGANSKAMQQQMESFECLRRQTLQNANLVQSEINELFNKINLDDNSYEFRPLEQPHDTPENPQLLKEKTEEGCNMSQLEQEEERRAFQGQLEEMGEREKMYTEDFKALLSKHEELQARNQALQAQQEQLELERERAQGEAAKMAEEREDLLAVIGAKEAVLRAERSKGAAEAARAGALRAENEELSRGLRRATEENASLRGELGKAECRVRCARAKHAVARTKNLMLFQLLQERSQSQEGPGRPNAEEIPLRRGALSPVKGSSPGKHEALSGHLAASSLLECKAAVDECWLLSARHTGIGEWDVHDIQAELEGEDYSAYSGVLLNHDTPGLCSQDHADKDPEQLNPPLASFNIITNPSAGDESLQTLRMPLRSSPREQSNINEVRKGFEELEEEQRHNIGSQPHNPVTLHSAAFRDRGMKTVIAGFNNTSLPPGIMSASSSTQTSWPVPVLYCSMHGKIQGMARGSGDASQVLQKHNLSSLSIERYSFGSDGKCTPPLTGGRPDLEKRLNWSNKDLDGCTDGSQKDVLHQYYNKATLNFLTSEGSKLQ